MPADDTDSDAEGAALVAKEEDAVVVDGWPGGADMAERADDAVAVADEPSTAA